MPATDLPLETTPRAVKSKLDDGEALTLIDVREPEEFTLTRLAGAELIPMRTVPAALQKLEAAADAGGLVIFCHHGMRSLQVAQWLRQHGIENVQSMAGGIERWSIEIDPAVPRY